MMIRASANPYHSVELDDSAERVGLDKLIFPCRETWLVRIWKGHDHAILSLVSDQSVAFPLGRVVDSV